MAGFVKLEQFKIVEMREGAVYKTKRLGTKWFPIGEQPKTNIPDKEGNLWAATTDYHFGPTIPKE